MYTDTETAGGFFSTLLTSKKLKTDEILRAACRRSYFYPQCLNPTEDPEKIGSLQQRNAELQAMVSQMRKDMEALSAQSQVQSQAFLPRMTYNGLPAQISTHLIPQSGGIHHEICQPNVSKSAPLHKQGRLLPS